MRLPQSLKVGASSWLMDAPGATNLANLVLLCPRVSVSPAMPTALPATLGLFAPCPQGYPGNAGR
jgi:hypothetical protein